MKWIWETSVTIVLFQNRGRYFCSWWINASAWKKKSKKLTMICCFDLMMLFRGSWKANEIFLNHVHGAFNYRHYLGDTWKHFVGIFCFFHDKQGNCFVSGGVDFFFQKIMHFRGSACFKCFSGLIKVLHLDWKASAHLCNECPFIAWKKDFLSQS